MVSCQIFGRGPTSVSLSLNWVEPVRSENGGLTRRINFETDFPPGVSSLLPLPVNFSVIAPASLAVPGEDGMDFAWTMPLLVRTRSAEPIPYAVSRNFGLDFDASDQKRPIIEVVTFLPFPRADAPPEEQFTPQFFIGMNIDSRQLGAKDNYFGSVVCFGGKVVFQFVSSERTSQCIFADPYHATPFRSELLAALTPEELASTPERAGTIDIFVYRLTRSFSDLIKGAIPSFGFGSDLSLPNGTLEHTFGRGSPTRSYNPSRGLSGIAGGGQKPALPSPSSVPKEVGDTRVSEGTAGKRGVTKTLSGYSLDPAFPFQQISIRVLGVREGAREALIRTLESIGSS